MDLLVGSRLLSSPAVFGNLALLWLIVAVCPACGCSLALVLILPVLRGLLGPFASPDDHVHFHAQPPHVEDLFRRRSHCVASC